MTMAKAGLQFNNKDEWYTPKYIVDYFGPFDYDPATTEEQAKYLGIPYFDTIKTNGLTRDWAQFPRIWINPPFTRKFEFLRKAANTVEWSHAHIFFLLPIDSMVTKKFADIMGGIDYTMHLPNGRIKFEDGVNKSTSPAFGSVILELGAWDGQIITHWRPYERRD